MLAENVEQSKRDIPADFQMPTSAEVKPPPRDDDGEEFWYDSGAESFNDSEEGSGGGGDSDDNMAYGTFNFTIMSFTLSPHVLISYR